MPDDEHVATVISAMIDRFHNIEQYPRDWFMDAAFNRHFMHRMIAVDDEGRSWTWYEYTYSEPDALLTNLISRTMPIRIS